MERPERPTTEKELSRKPPDREEQSKHPRIGERSRDGSKGMYIRGFETVHT